MGPSPTKIFILSRSKHNIHNISNLQLRCTLHVAQSSRSSICEIEFKTKHEGHNNKSFDEIILHVGRS